ncbi:GH20823 [Drosophila grimshawi]|uniref:GH20823 n=2 Tax=Drosophila grimshawi TaxID=7222 RepID=B4J5V2_DROGR|nr:GH20823 [Drosophila grimshawi]
MLLRVLVLHLLISLARAQRCSREYNLRTNQRFNITSPNYPGTVPPGSNCRYLLRAPVNHVIQLTCRFEVSPDVCQSKFLFISRDGDIEFRNAERFCRRGQVTRTSNFQSISVGYQSSSTTTQQSARLSCQAVARRVACDCGWSQPMRIANGREAAKHEFPSMVGIRDAGSNLPIFCGGSIVSDRYIVTAAHCTLQRVASRLLALVGDHDLSSSSESIFARQYAIQSIINHPAYNSERNLNDISLLRTVASMEFSRGVAPICLPFRQTPLGEDFDVVEIAGWGTLGFGAAKSNTLQKATLMTLQSARCSALYNTSIASSQLCTYDHLGLGQDSCQYDSGGPVIQRQRSRMFLLGVISFGRACGQRFGFGVNTRVSSYVTWLQRNLGGSACVR